MMIPAFQGFRFVAIVIVILVHVREFKWWSFNWYGCGMWSVALFFAMSGFLSGYRDRGTTFSFPAVLRNLGRRVSRFYPLYFLAIVLGARFLRGVKCLVQGVNPIPDVWDGWPLLHFGLLQSWDPTCYEWFLPLSWFLSTMLFLYLAGDLMLPLLRKLSSRGLVLVVVGGCLFPVILSWPVAPSDAALRLWTQIFPPSRVPEYIAMIAFGMLCARKDAVPPANPTRVSPTVMEGMALAILAFAMMMPWDWTSVTIRWIVPDLLLLAAFRHGSGVFSRVLGSRPLVWLGGLTLPVYLFHVHVLKFVALLMKQVALLPEESSAFTKISGLGISIVLIYAFATGYVLLVRRHNRKGAPPT